MSNNQYIVKTVLHVGTTKVNFEPGTKVIFHYKTTKCNPDKTVIDDSRQMKKPMELIIGKQFKFEVWEVIVQQMALNEVACFRVHADLVSEYPFVSRTIREANKPKLLRCNHSCALIMSNMGIDYKDLDELIRYPQDLEFTIELIKVVQPDEYEKETWLMTRDEKLEKIPQLKEKGNALVRENKIDSAAESYAKAIGMLEVLMIDEEPHEEDWLALNRKKVPLLLNYAQCKLLNKEYYSVIEHCTTVLKIDPDNVKALYRRGKAHIYTWNERNAIKDLRRAAEIDPSLRNTIEKELQIFALAIKMKNMAEGKKLSKMFK